MGLSRQRDPRPGESHYQTDDDSPLLARFKAQSLAIQKQEELIRQLQQQLQDGGATSTPPSNPRRLRQRLENNDSQREWLDQQVRKAVQRNLEMVGLARDRLSSHEADNLSTSPFSPEIGNFPLPKDFSVPRFIPYDGTSDPAAHLRHFTQRMSLWGDIGPLNCRVFSSSLGDLPLKWFCTLPQGSITSWKQLRNSFIAKFQVHRVIPRSDADLMALRMKRTESIAQFVKRFWTVYSQIEEASNTIAIESFQQALLPGSELRKDLVLHPVVTMKALVARVNRFIEQEADEAKAQECFDLYGDKTASSSAETASSSAETSSSSADVPSSAGVSTSGDN